MHDTSKGIKNELQFPFIFILIIIMLILGISYYPQVTSTIILIILIIWVYKTFALIILGLKHFTQVQISESLDWFKKYKSLENGKTYKEELEVNISKLEEIFNKMPLFEKIFIRLSNKSRLYSTLLTYKQELHNLISLQEGSNIKRTTDITNLLVIASYKESFSTVSRLFKSLLRQNYDLTSLYIVLATEGRDTGNIDLFEKLKTTYGHKVPNFLMTTHTLKMDEEAGKGSNCKDSIIKSVEILKNHGINIEDTIVTITDADVVFSPNYFASLTYNFCISTKRYTALFHATPQFILNYKSIHAFSRVMGTFNTLDTLKNIGNKYTHPQSTYSLSLKTLIEIGLWDNDVMSEDEHIYKKMFLKYSEDFTLVPLYIEIYLTMPNAEKYISSFKTAYEQMQRWIYGALIINKDIVSEFSINNRLSIKDRVFTSFDSLERTVLWPFYSLFLVFGITIIQLIRTSFTSDEFILAVHYITILLTILNAISILLITLLDYYIRKNHEFSRLKFTEEIYNMRRWLYLPVVSLLLGFIPYVDANLRIMLKKDLKYKTAQKE